MRVKPGRPRVLLAGLLLAGCPVPVGGYPLPALRRWLRQRQVHQRDHLLVVAADAVRADRAVLIAEALDRHRDAADLRLEGGRETLLKCGLEPHELLGVVVRVDDGFLNHLGHFGPAQLLHGSKRKQPAAPAPGKSANWAT